MKSKSEAAIDVLSSSLHRQPSGIWTTDGAAAELSYPKSGHDSCFQFEEQSFWFAHRNRCISAMVNRHGVTGPFLDIGGGNGFVSLALEREGLQPVLLEPGSSGARNGVARGLSTVVCATLEEAHFHDGAFPSAGAFDVVEHIEDDATFLKSVLRVLKPGGHFLVTVPSHSWLWSHEDDFAGHFRRPTLRGLRRSLEDAGFTWVSGSYIFGALVLPILLLRCVPYRLGLAGRGGENPEKDHVHGNGQGQGQGMMSGLLKAALAPELRMIRAGRCFPFGASCLALVRKS